MQIDLDVLERMARSYGGDVMRLRGTQVEAIIAKVRELEHERERYHTVRAWYLRGGARVEIDPLGHIRFTTPEIFDAGVDAMLAASKGG